jgi:hypothetical protein
MVILLQKYTILTYLPRKMEQTECSETSAYKIQTPGNYPEENIQQKYTSFVTAMYFINNKLVAVGRFSATSALTAISGELVALRVE